MDRQDIPQGWYDLVVVGNGWEAIGAAWYARQLGGRVAILPGAESTDASLKLPAPLCQWWNFCHVGWPTASAGQRGVVCWQPPSPFFVEGLCRGGQSRQSLSIDKALGQLAAAGVAVFRGPACFQAPDVLEVQGHPVPFRKVLLAPGQQKKTLSLPGAEPGQIISLDQLGEQFGFAGLAGGSQTTSKPVGSACAGFASLHPPGSLATPGKVPQPSLVGEEVPRFAQRIAIFAAGLEECFWAQWLARQGWQVHLLPAEAEILPDHPPEICQWIQACLLQDGVRIHRHAVFQQVQPAGQGKFVLLDRLGQQEKLVVDFLAAAPERKPAIAGLQLERAGVPCLPSGVPIDSSCRTTNRRIFAAGTVCGSEFSCPRIAWSMVQWAAAKALGRRPPKRDWHLRFRCIPTDPPIFWLGQSPAEAEHQFWQVCTYRVEASCRQTYAQPASEIADAEVPSGSRPNETSKRPPSFLQVHLRRRTGRIVGAVVAGPRAHELADLLACLIQQKISLPKWLASTGCVSAGMQLLAEVAQRAQQDHPPHWWDLPIEHLQRLWQKWRSRRSPSA